MAEFGFYALRPLFSEKPPPYRQKRPLTEAAIAALLSYLNTLPEPRIVVSRDYTILGANRAYLEHYHAGDKPVAGRHCYEVSHHFSRPCDEEGESCPLKSAITDVLEARRSPPLAKMPTPVVSGRPVAASPIQVAKLP